MKQSNGLDLAGRFMDAFRSLNAAPLWVRVWVWCGLLPVNGAALWLWNTTGHPLAMWTGIGFLFVICTNMPIALYERGISKLTSLPHLIPWIPGQIYAGYWLFMRGDALSSPMTVFAWAYFVIIGVSNVFDIYDTFRWFRGERDTLGST